MKVTSGTIPPELPADFRFLQSPEQINLALEWVYSNMSCWNPANSWKWGPAGTESKTGMHIQAHNFPSLRQLKWSIWALSKWIQIVTASGCLTRAFLINSRSRTIPPSLVGTGWNFQRCWLATSSTNSTHPTWLPEAWHNDTLLKQHSDIFLPIDEPVVLSMVFGCIDQCQKIQVLTQDPYSITYSTYVGF